MTTPYGVHGYDNWNPDMKPFFIAKGPSFKKGVIIDDDFANIDVIYLLCRRLGIKCPQRVDGIDRTELWDKMLN